MLADQLYVHVSQYAARGHVHMIMKKSIQMHVAT